MPEEFIKPELGVMREEEAGPALGGTEKELKDLLEENVKMSQEILRLSKRINNFVIIQQIFGVIKILLIVVPIVLGIIYLPSLLSSYFEPYQELLDVSGSLKGLNVERLIK